MVRRRRGASMQVALPTWVGVAVIIILAIVSLVLSYLAFQGANPSDKEQGFLTVKSVQDVPSAAPQLEGLAPPESINVDDSPVEPERIPLAAPQRLLGLDGDLAVRSTVGECTAPGSIEFSIDGGTNWTSSTSFRETSATQILRLLPTTGATTFVVALNGDCMPQVYSTPDNGQTWGAPVPAVGTWYLNPASPTELGAPGGPKTIGCDGVALSPVTERQVGVLCSDGSLIQTTNAGTTWSEPIPAEGALALANSKEELSAALQNEESCVGLQIAKYSEGDSTEYVSCISLDLNEIGAGQISVAQSGETILAWVGDNLISSKDGGQTWL